MSLANQVLAVNNDFPIKTDLPIHSGKVRSVYWLTDQDSRRLIKENNYPVAKDAPLAIMIISDRVSAFDCIWQGEEGLNGVPGKGVALNSISNHWFSLFKEQGLADSHILDIPHPYVWIVQKARPVMIEAICRQYITGSMWRSYKQGERDFCGIQIPEGLTQDQKLPELLLTPSTKGILTNIEGVPAVDDVNITRNDIERNYDAFGFNSLGDINQYEKLLTEGFDLISQSLDKIDQVFVDTKFEFGYVHDADGNEKLIYMDEVGTPDSSRIWDKEQYSAGNIVENSKEGFRQFLLNHFPEPDILLNKARMEERLALAENNPLPKEAIFEISNTYINIAEKIIGEKITIPENPRAEIISVLKEKYHLIN
ncbi:phosphoribosylaminoimidazolesuccinocarboxamide synthase [Vibrio sp. SS-MA-C1-2]|uniref:phosphoribosylaminoimidazolesuccinocarboxamide synthase n=1 Tax=Vibrio sp. SS-MA-C1-2 TaxID=2908646 RepID=UPI001F1C0CD8|nr:phosphoribosylaminoimidazolesuccinocarboxamide synthase [Vibrio sp. SS-MA-C1-2]UJF17761.1 phosphoribosylaminoimidazolesuccinocarboxamide synthase [Vibrio sp. SS-MA-C1-2]